MDLSSFIVPGVFLVSVLAVIAVIKAASAQYHTVSPNQVAVVYGRKNKLEGRTVGYRIVTGGGFFKIPVFERVQYLHLNVMTMTVEVKAVPDKNGALVNVKGVANVKILSEAASLALAIERFLGTSEEKIKDVAKENLEGNLRAIVGSLTIDELIKDRQALQGKILQEAAADLAKLGLGVDLLTIQDINDERNYIASLGKKQTAEVIRNATIGEAEAKRDADIRSADALQRGEMAKAKAEQEISNASRERDMIKANNDAKVAAEQARIPIAAQIAAAEEQKTLNVRNVDAQKAKTLAEKELQVVERERHEAELNATLIVKAEKDKEATIIAAQAEQEAATRIGEAKRIALEKEGEGFKAKLTNEAEGRKKAAEATQSELEAQASGERAKLLAEAEGIRQKLLAEAEGSLKKAEAYKAMDETGRLLMLLQLSPSAIHAIGEVVARFMEPVAGAIGSGLGNIDEVRIIDMGAGDGRNALQQFSRVPTETIFTILEKIKALGLEKAVQSATGIDLTALTAGAPPQKNEPEHMNGEAK